MTPFELFYRGNRKLPYDLEKLEKAQPAITCSKLTIETLEQGVKYILLLTLSK